MGSIGVFDSGYGGLTVLGQFIDTLPDYDFLYLGDNARSPYGIRSFDTIYEYTREAVRYLASEGCPLIILACNTASAKALKNIQLFDIPKINPALRVLGVIRPTAESIGDMTHTGHVGVLATKGTVTSQSYILEIKKLYPDVHVHQQACPMWVPLVENGELDSEGARFFIKRDLDELMSCSSNIDTVLLGCTHYPVIAPIIREYLPKNVRIVSQGPIVANSLADYLHRHRKIDDQCSKSGMQTYLTTGSCDDFDRHASEFLGFDISSQRVENLESFLYTW